MRFAALRLVGDVYKETSLYILYLFHTRLSDFFFFLIFRFSVFSSNSFYHFLSFDVADVSYFSTLIILCSSFPLIRVSLFSCKLFHVLQGVQR